MDFVVKLLPAVCLSVTFMAGLIVGGYSRRHVDAAVEAACYWRKAYHDLVAQTGRDLNDGRGRCSCGRQR